MRDYTYEGVPVSKMLTQDIIDCLAGVEITDMSEFKGSEEDAKKAVHQRLLIELEIRKQGLR